MAASSVQQTTIGWQLRKFGQYVSEWLELHLFSGRGRSTSEPPPGFELPPWLGQLLLWFSIVVGVLALSWFLWQLLLWYVDNRPTQRPVKTSLIQAPEPEAGVAEWLRRAKRWEQEGNWPAACRALYMAALQKLHDRQWIPHLPGRTDGEYLHGLAARQVPQPRPYQLLIRTHERAEFGGVLPTAENLKRCRQAYREIEKT